MLTMLPKMIVPAALAVAVSLSAAPARADEATSRWIAALPFGAGQVHRGDIGLGLYFAAGEALLGGASIAAAAYVGALTSAASAPPEPGQKVVDIRALNAELRTATMVNRIAFAGWAALTAAGVVEAQLSISRRSSASRDQPSPPLRLTAAPVPGGASIGLHLSF
jgi:uncharacterized protein with PIN domain